MNRPRLDVAEVIRSCSDDFVKLYGSRLTPGQQRAWRDLVSCRTAALGGPRPGVSRMRSISRLPITPVVTATVPPARALPRRGELEAREPRSCSRCRTSMSSSRFPKALDPIAPLHNPRVVYNLLLRSAAETLLQVAANPEHLGAQISVLAVLHTWGQNLQLHPHVHCVVPGGGLSPDGTRWISSSSNFFLPVRVLSAVFRGKFLAALRAAFAEGQLRFPDARPIPTARIKFERLLAVSTRTDWVVYAKQPFGGPEQVLKYLAQYTHRTAISNHRLLDFDKGQVSFRYKDYAHGCRKRTMRISAVEFLRRFLLHVLPAGFVRIRHYGILSNRHRHEKLALCRSLLKPRPAAEPELPGELKIARENPPSINPTRVCPVCGAGRMIVLQELPRQLAPRAGDATTDRRLIVDSS